jgi:hypothetical protein
MPTNITTPVKASKPKYKDFTMGADPEFVIYNKTTGSLLESENEVNSYSRFGADGNGITFEVRPLPSKNPLQVVSSIHNIFTGQVLASPKLFKHEWKAGSFYDGCPLGGHIHFGVGGDEISYATTASILDNYLGALTLLMEDYDEGLSRRSEGYGFAGDYRTQDWGMEYRPCSSWLTSPYVSAAVLCLAKTIVFEVMNNPNFKPRHYTNRDVFEYMKTDYLQDHFPKAWEEITKMKLYQSFKPYIDIIYHIIKSKKCWYPNTDMKTAWGIVDVSSMVKNKIGMDVVWQRFINTSNRG